jgi:hypothetical protein
MLRQLAPPPDTPRLTWWGAYWAAWIVFFLIPELYWVFVNSANTLSRETWALEQVNLSQPFDFGMWTGVHWAIAIVVWLLFLWLSLHLPFGLLR